MIEKRSRIKGTKSMLLSTHLHTRRPEIDVNLPSAWMVCLSPRQDKELMVRYYHNCYKTEKISGRTSYQKHTQA